MRREPPAVDFLREERVRRLGGPDALVGVANVCPVEGCDAWGIGEEPDCDHEYPGRCPACDTIVGDRYSDLEWAGVWLGADQWLCERCRSYCEECGGEGKVTFDGVCGDCCRVVADDGTVLHEGKAPTLELTWSLGWRRLSTEEIEEIKRAKEQADDADLFVATEPVEPWLETEPVDDIPD